MKTFLKFAAALSVIITFFAFWIPYVNPKHGPAPVLAAGETPIISTTGHTGYTIFVRPQGELAPTYPSTFIRKVWTPPSFYIHSPLAENRTELWEDSAGIDTLTDVKAACPAFVPQHITLINQIFDNALAKTLSTNAVRPWWWSENYEAASAVTNGRGDTVMKGGKTAEQYLTLMGAGLDMTALQMAQSVITEYRNNAPKAERIGNEYMRIIYKAIPNATLIGDLLRIPADYQLFCNQ